MIEIKTILEQATQLLSSTSPSARLDAELLLGKMLNVTRVFLYAHSNDSLSNIQQENYDAMIKKRSEGMPVAYIVGQREFWSLPIQVTMDTLIPRPETELLVECLLKQFANQPCTTILDLGTGSGAIALALASERPQWDILAVDISKPAIKIAVENAINLNINNVKVLCSDWFEAIPAQKFTAIVSNPPYLAQNDTHLHQGDLRYEPQNALVSGQDGLDALNHIIQQSVKWLIPGGWLLLEHGYSQSSAVLAQLKAFGYQNVQSWQDIQGHDRISGGQINPRLRRRLIHTKI